MTLKQLFKRYLKERGYYGTLLEFIMSNYGLSMTRCRRLLELCTAIDLFYYTVNMSRQYGVRWYYVNKSFFDFVHDWCDYKCDIKKGDIITVKTLDGKYEFTYTVLDVWLTKMEIETDNNGFIKLERISKVNGKKCNYVNDWKFKKDTSKLIKR